MMYHVNVVLKHPLFLKHENQDPFGCRLNGLPHLFLPRKPAGIFAES